MRQELAGSLTRAKTQYERGKYDKAGTTLGEARERAESWDDPESTKVVDDWIANLGTSLNATNRTVFDAAIAAASDSARKKRPQTVDVSPVGLVLASLGAAAMLIAVFLPYADAGSAGFFRIEKNTLIQNGNGWVFIILSLIGAVRVYAVYRSRKRTWAPVITGAIGIAYAAYFGSNGGDSLKLCSVATGTDCQIASPGTGVYLAGVGGLLMVVGGLLILGSKKAETSPDAVVAADQIRAGLAPDPRPTKDCPECAETILAAARVCKHCGYRYPFAEEQVIEAPVPAATGIASSVTTVEAPALPVAQPKLGTAFCPQCWQHAPEGATTCAHCGTPLPAI